MCACVPGKNNLSSSGLRVTSRLENGFRVIQLSKCVLLAFPLSWAWGEGEPARMTLTEQGWAEGLMSRFGTTVQHVDTFRKNGFRCVNYKIRLELKFLESRAILFCNPT